MWDVRSKYKTLKKNKHFKRLTNKYCLASIIFVFVICFIDSNNMFIWSRLKLKIREQENVVDIYKNRISELDTKIEELTKNKTSLEKFAREKYFFQMTNEEVFILQ